MLQRLRQSRHRRASERSKGRGQNFALEVERAAVVDKTLLNQGVGGDLLTANVVIVGIDSKTVLVLKRVGCVQVPRKSFGDHAHSEARRARHGVKQRLALKPGQVRQEERLERLLNTFWLFHEPAVLLKAQVPGKETKHRVRIRIQFLILLWLSSSGSAGLGHALSPGSRS